MPGFVKNADALGINLKGLDDIIISHGHFLTFHYLILYIIISFISPFVAFLDSIPGCVMGGVCITLYGFIAVSGLKMIQKVDLEDNANLFTVSVILITGIGGMAMKIGEVVITSIACALILGIIINIILTKFKKA